MTIASSAVYDERYRGDYREQLAGFEIARWKALEHFVRRVVRPGLRPRVLDYGAGSGLHVELWERLFPGSELHFCDVSAVAMEKFARKYPRHAGRYRLLDGIRASQQEGTFDLVVSVEVMEHVGDLHAYVRDIHRLLRPGGWFVWTTPCGNPGSIEHVYSALTGGIQATRDGYRRWAWEDPTHERRLRSREIEGVLLRCGFGDVRFRFRSHLFSFLCTYYATSRFAGIRNRLMALDYLLFRRLPNGASMIGAAEKIEERDN